MVDGDDQHDFPEPEGDHRVVDERNDALYFAAEADDEDDIVVRIPHGRYETARELASAIENGNVLVGQCVVSESGRFGFSIVEYESDDVGKEGVNRRAPTRLILEDCWKAAFLLGMRNYGDFEYDMDVKMDINLYYFSATRPSPLPAN